MAPEWRTWRRRRVAPIQDCRGGDAGTHIVLGVGRDSRTDPFLLHTACPEWLLQLELVGVTLEEDPSPALSPGRT